MIVDEGRVQIPNFLVDDKLPYQLSLLEPTINKLNFENKLYLMKYHNHKKKIIY